MLTPTLEAGVTVVVPNWNHGCFLPRCLTSAVAAARHLERGGLSADIIVIDDASRDGSQKLLRSLALAYNNVLPVLLRDNCGLPGVRNLGLRLARHRYALMLDADNEVEPENLPIFLQAMRDTRAALVYGNLIERRDPSDQPVALRSNEPATLRLTLGNYIDAFALVDVEKVLRLGGYTQNPKLCGREDWELLLHLIAEEESIVFVPVVMGYYYLNRLSMLADGNRTLPGAVAVLQRVFAQSGSKEWDTRRVGRVYHPDVGFLDGHWVDCAQGGEDAGAG
jgi:succinoglycan biosynthesis protein ExoO